MFTQRAGNSHLLLPRRTLVAFPLSLLPEERAGTWEKTVHLKLSFFLFSEHPIPKALKVFA
jgi:hypothetical protein